MVCLEIWKFITLFDVIKLLHQFFFHDEFVFEHFKEYSVNSYHSDNETE